MRVPRIGRGIDREIAALCGLIFLADVVTGFLPPTFPLFAESLRVSLAGIGLISTAGGLAQLVLALPVGVLSDRVGRKRLFGAGMAGFTAMLLCFAAAGGPLLLVAGRILYGVASVAVFQIGAAHLGDISKPGERAVAFGAFTTAMGTGFTIGPLLGGQIADHFGFRAAYLVAAAIAAVATFAVGWALRDRVGRGRSGAATIRLLDGVRHVMRQGDLIIVSFGSLLMSLTFAGAVSTFFPIFGGALGLTEAAIGWMFAIRALVSTLGRMPQGVIARLFGHQPVMLACLVVDAVVMFFMAGTRVTPVLTVLLAGEGLAYGAYLVAGQTYVAERTTIEVRGSAGGVYSTAGSIGGSVGPLLLGILAGRSGVASVFTATGWALALGALVFLAAALLLHRAGQRAGTRVARL
ncbi:MAG TPA: MFS transporter [Thermomicrobiaceae bacterium]|nr:MFS transporter [Thermomicrobiaceae bacterium]